MHCSRSLTHGPSSRCSGLSSQVRLGQHRRWQTRTLDLRAALCVFCDPQRICRHRMCKYFGNMRKGAGHEQRTHSRVFAVAAGMALDASPFLVADRKAERAHKFSYASSLTAARKGRLLEGAALLQCVAHKLSSQLSSCAHALGVALRSFVCRRCWCHTAQHTFRNFVL